MKVNNILSVIDVTNVNIFKVNGIPIPFTVLNQTYSEHECHKVQIKTALTDMIPDDVKYDIVADCIEVEATVELQLPNTSAYVNIELNFILEGDEIHA